MRVGLIAASVVAAVLAGALATHVALAAVGAGPSAARAAAVRTDPPVALGSGAAPSLTVHLHPANSSVPASGEFLDVVVRVENPNAAPVSGVRVSLDLVGGRCDWLEGPFPNPFGLSPAASSARTCRFRHTDAGPGSIHAVVAHHGTEVASDHLRIERSQPPIGALPPTPTAPGITNEPRVEGGGAPPAPATSTLRCPRLRDGLELIGSPLLDDLGPTMSDLARLLDIAGCPSWAPTTGLVAARQQTGEPCPPWLVTVAGSADPVARLTAGQHHAACPAAPLDIEVFDQPTEMSAMITALAAWAVDGDSTRAGVFHRAAMSGEAAGCAAGGIVAVRNPYEQGGATGRSYRVTLTSC